MAATATTETNPTTISDVAAMLQAYTKLFSNIQNLPAFATEGFGYNEWMMLRLLADDPDLRAGGLAGKLGLSAQRAAQILIPLRKNGYLKATPEAGDSRKNALTLTVKGEAKLKAVDAEILEFFAPTLNDKPKALSVVRNFARAMIRRPKASA